MITPLLHHVLVKPEQFAEVNKDMKRLRDIGLVAPEMEDMKRAQAGVDTGIVVSLGSTAYRDYNVEAPIKVGDRVNYARFSGKLISDPGSNDEYICLNDSDILCIIKG